MYLTISQAAERLSVGYNTVRRAIFRTTKKKSGKSFGGMLTPNRSWRIFTSVTHRTPEQETER